MYSKQAMERYEELLNKVSPAVEFTKTAKLDPAHWAALLGIPAAGGLGMYLGAKAQEATDDWTKMKYGLGGLGLGLAAPIMYKALTGGKDLSALAGQLSGNNYQPDYADFTSI